MDKIQYIYENMYRIYGIQMRCQNKDGEILSMRENADIREDPFVSDVKLFRELYHSSTAHLYPYGVYLEDNLFCYAFLLDGENLYTMGPIALSNCGLLEKTHYLNQHGLSSNSGVYYIPVFPDLESITNIMAFALGLICGHPLTASDLCQNEIHMVSSDKTLMKKQTAYSLENADNEFVHFPYAFEEEFWENFRNGNFDKDAAQNSISKFSAAEGYTQGRFGKTELKNIEYSCVSIVTLATRHAIRAGVSESLAYELSDATLQNISSTSNPLQMNAFVYRALGNFSDAIKTAQKKSSDNFYVRQCQNYISKHIFGEISLSDISESLHVNASYLSRIFSQNMGISITSYIQQEKIMLACNLLKYSEEPVPVIAEYVHLTPQSRFSTIFKKYTGTSPAKYRAENKDSTFSSR